jgi:hypothetical protein
MSIELPFQKHAYGLLETALKIIDSPGNTHSWIRFARTARFLLHGFLAAPFLYIGLRDEPGRLKWSFFQ